MLITYDEYKGFGYNTVDEAAFPRFAYFAEGIVRKYTSGRVTKENITDTNKRGVCEIIDILFARPKATGAANENGEAIAGFSNSKYSESYVTGEQAHATAKAADVESVRILELFFTANQLWRSV